MTIDKETGRGGPTEDQMLSLYASVRSLSRDQLVSIFRDIPDLEEVKFNDELPIDVTLLIEPHISKLER